MPYGKSKYRRKYARKGRSTVARVAKGRVTQVQALAKSVRALQLKTRSEHQFLQYVQSASQLNIDQPLTSINLCNFSSWTPVFGSAANDATHNRIVHKSMRFDGYISLENLFNNEEDTIDMTAFVVSLRDPIGSAFAPSSGALTLSQGPHYYIQDGLCMVNPKIFKIHKVMRKVLTNHGSALGAPSAQTQGGTDWRFSFRLNPNCVVTNPYGDWSVMSTAQDPSKQYYFLIFNNNSVLDAESPAITFNCVHTMRTIV